MKRTVFLIGLCLSIPPFLWGQESKQVIEVFPKSPFSQYIIYGTLTIFWIAIIGLIIILRMKLKEIERVQRMGLDI